MSFAGFSHWSTLEINFLYCLLFHREYSGTVCSEYGQQRRPGTVPNAKLQHSWGHASFMLVRTITAQILAFNYMSSCTWMDSTHTIMSTFIWIYSTYGPRYVFRHGEVQHNIRLQFFCTEISNINQRHWRIGLKLRDWDVDSMVHTPGLFIGRREHVQIKQSVLKVT